MQLKSNRAFSLIEVIITVAILSSAIVFIFRAFTALLSYAKLSRDITVACYLAEDKLWQVQQRWTDLKSPLEPSGRELIQEQTFSWNYNTEEIQESLTKLTLTVSWKESINRQEEYSFDTYLFPK